ncbi:MAG: glycosyltransferase family 39 protein [Proteobacteria bacterium]|nr:glycosyltransferase family 39 protein [Pseudomonadota bacterium]
MKITTDQKDQKNLTLPFLLVLCGYFALHIALRVTISGSLDYDEAEQALLSQWLLAGYTEQPPLYTWIQHFLFTLFGKNVFAVSLLKNGLLLLTYICVFFAGREILGDDRPAILAAVSLLLIPQIGWESQRDMTHTTLVVFAAAATLWQVLRLVKNQRLMNYCTLGLLLGTGFLAKANFALFILVLLLTLSCFAEGRKVLFSRKILISLLITVAFTGTYVLWMVGNQDIVFSATYKFKRAVENSWHKGPISLISTIFQFLTPLWLICLCVFPAGFNPKGNSESGFHRRFINRYLFFLLIVLFTAVIVGKVTYVKDRWLQPLLFVVPIFFFARLSLVSITESRFKLFLRIVAVAALAIYLVFTIRVAGASFTGRVCRLNYPFTIVADEMRRLGFTNGLIISDDRFVAGNLHVQFPGSTALIPKYHFETLVDNTRYSQAAVVWQAAQLSEIPADLQNFLETTYKLQVTDYPVHYLELPYLFANSQTVTLAVLLLPLATPQKPALGAP